MKYIKILNIKNVHIFYYIIIFLFSNSVHEYFHCYSANYFGDNTSKSMGRLTLNPIKHIDAIGTFFLPLILYYFFDSNYFFTYSRPILINYNKFRSDKGYIITILAGPLSNFVLFLIFFFLLFVTKILFSNIYLSSIFYIGIFINLGMFIFNLLPLLPLDGGKIVLNVFLKKKFNSKSIFIKMYSMFSYFIILCLFLNKNLFLLIFKFLIKKINYML